MMGQEKILVGGDWNAHSDIWDPQCPPKRNANFLENLMDEYDLIDVTDGEATHVSERMGEVSCSLIDFFITKASIADRLEIATDLETTSDHVIVCAQLRWDEGEGAKVSRMITGWDIDKPKEEGKKENYKKDEKQWEEKSGSRPVLNENSSEDKLHDEAGWIQRNFINHLNRCCKKIKICARSKRWWTQEIAENRKILGSIKRVRKRGEATQKQITVQ
jgi:hypothetical protein